MTVTVNYPTGILAIWNDCAGGHEDEYEAWYMWEHLPERMAVPGFRRGRRYEAVTGKPRFFTYYETDSPAVLSSPDYLARLDDPTPLTRRIMSGIFTNIDRTIFRRIVLSGEMRGSFAVTARFAGDPGEDHLTRAATMVSTEDGVARAEAWLAAGLPDLEMSAEESLRGGDRHIAACLFVETLRERDATAIRRQISEHWGPESETGIYRLLGERAA